MQREVFVVKSKGGSKKGKAVRKVWKRLSEFPEAKQEISCRTKHDVFGVLRIAKARIGIESNPHNGHLGKSLEVFKHLGCDIIVCAMLTSGPSVKAVKRLKGYKESTFLMKGDGTDAADVATSIVTTISTMVQ